MSENKKNKFDEWMLDFICCPNCQSDFEYNLKESVLICKNCKKSFVVKDGIPILLEKS